MLSAFCVSAFLAVFLGVFYAINLANATKVIARRGGAGRPVFAGAERPKKVGLFFVALGTLAFFLEATACAFGVVFGDEWVCEQFMFQPHLPYAVGLQLGGAILMTCGGIGFLWSILKRGRRRNIGKLVTWGSFRYVRHPSYLGYSLMFFGFLFFVVCPVALIPLSAIPGYLQLTYNEERLLIKEFGDQYVKYQRRTGRFVPRV